MTFSLDFVLAPPLQQKTDDGGWRRATGHGIAGCWWRQSGHGIEEKETVAGGAPVEKRKSTWFGASVQWGAGERDPGAATLGVETAGEDTDRPRPAIGRVERERADRSRHQNL
jgi:hypothetical protein